jgi:hypothetical protein
MYIAAEKLNSLYINAQCNTWHFSYAVCNIESSLTLQMYIIMKDSGQCYLLHFVRESAVGFQNLHISIHCTKNVLHFFFHVDSNSDK